MVSPDEDRILYDDPDAETEPVSPRLIAAGLAVLALMVGMVYVPWRSLNSSSIEDGPPRETVAAVAAPPRGFDASSSDFKACEEIGSALPDFSIVVGGTAGGGQDLVPRVVQFVVVEDHHDYRYGRDLRAESLCTLP